MPNDVIQIIATSINNNIRMIEGAFNRIVAYANLMNMPINREMTLKILDEFSVQTINNVTIDKIIDYVCKIYNMQYDDIVGKKRPKNIAMARQVAMYLCRKITDASLPKIGQAFGGRDHTTVIHAYEKIEKMRKEDKSFESQLQQYEEKIRSL